jgi:hypothetical protein
MLVDLEMVIPGELMVDITIYYCCCGDGVVCVYVLVLRESGQSLTVPLVT